MPSYFVTVDGEEVQVGLEPLDNGNYRMRLEDREHEVDARTVRGDVLSMLIDGISYDVDFERRKPPRDKPTANLFNVRLHSQVVPVEVLDERQRNLRDLAGTSAATGGRREISAPMPGKVIKFLVKAGDSVQAGQGVVVVEAMKMENEITSPGDGTVQELRAEVGQAVEAGAVLLVVE